jgi:putative Mg2+ transporter-C (MgtC) family protein
VGDIEETARPDDSVHIVARLVSTAVDPNEMDAIVDALRQSDAVSDAAWKSSTTH